MDLRSIINDLYDNTSTQQEVEKTAEAVFVQELRGLTPQSNAPDLSNMSMDDLIKLAQDLKSGESTQVQQYEQADDEEELQKVAAMAFGGQVSAHAIVHEFALIKQAVANGYCRACKTNGMDIEGSSVCSHCLE